VFKLVIATEVKILKKKRKSLECVLCAGKVDNEYACVLEYAKRSDQKKKSLQTKTYLRMYTSVFMKILTQIVR
jgi:hypothetical protein